MGKYMSLRYTIHVYNAYVNIGGSNIAVIRDYLAGVIYASLLLKVLSFHHSLLKLFVFVNESRSRIA